MIDQRRSATFATFEAQLEQALQDLNHLVVNFQMYQTQLVPELDEQVFAEVVACFEQLSQQIQQLQGYAEWGLIKNMHDQVAQRRETQIQAQTLPATQAMRFFLDWWQQLDEPTAQRLMNTLPSYRYWLQTQRHTALHALDRLTEHAVALKNATGRHALQQLYAQITSRYTYSLVIDGEPRQLTASELPPHALGPNRELRWQIVQEVYRVFAQDSELLGSIYQHLVQDWVNEYVTLRGFPSAIAVRNQSNDLPDYVVQMLLGIEADYVDTFQRYMDFKARSLDIPNMCVSDLLAPIKETSPTYSLDQAIELIFAAFYDFDPECAQIIQHLFEQHQIDAEPRQGKKRGAWCFAWTPAELPWISLSYNEQLYDVLMLAHECGHGLHAVLANHQSILNYTISLPLAETASIFAELVVIEYLLKHTTDPNTQRYLLFRQLDDVYLSIHRQLALTRFEQQAFTKIPQGSTLTELAEDYMHKLQAEFGPNVEIPKDMCWEFLTLPMVFYQPFYSYSYAFGQLLALALYQRYREQGNEFIPTFRAILAAGGSDSPQNILKQAHIDIHSPTFWRGGFAMIDSMIELVMQT